MFVPLRDRLPTRRLPIVNYLLLAANVLVFAWEWLLLSAAHPLRQEAVATALVRLGGLVPRQFVLHPLEHMPHLFTSMFMHDPSGLAHIGGNMLFLWIFGDNVEDAMGHLRYAVFYVVSGLAAAAAQILIDPLSQVPMVGASGAIAGVLAAYGALYPRSPVTVFNPVLPLWLFFGPFLEFPAWIVILEFFLYNLWHGLGSVASLRSGGVAFFAHLGGFVAGLLLVRSFVEEVATRSYDRWSSWRPPPRRVTVRRAPGGPWGR